MSGGDVRKEPCSACPYRQDAPSGLWAASEYEKLEAYDRPTALQPQGWFACHSTPDHICNGWAIAHPRSLAMRLYELRRGPQAIPEAHVPMFDCGTDAAAHGKRDVDDPSPEAMEKMVQLMAKYPRLRYDDEDGKEVGFG